MKDFLKMLKAMLRKLAAALGFTLLAGGCDKDATLPPISKLPTVTMRVGAKIYNLEIAATEPMQQLGLMRRNSMPADHGMIFVFPDERDRGFWMKDVRFGLFIVFMDHDGRVVSTAHMRSYDQTTTPSNGPIQYAIELNDDQEQACGVKPGDVLVIPAAAQAPASQPQATGAH